MLNLPETEQKLNIKTVNLLSVQDVKLMISEQHNGILALLKQLNKLKLLKLVLNIYRSLKIVE